MNSFCAAIANEDDIDQIMLLIYKVHGFSLYESWMYNKQEIFDRIRTGKIVFFVVKDYKNNVKAMLCLTYPLFPMKNSCSFGMFFTDPDVRGMCSAYLVNLLGNFAYRYIEKLINTKELLLLQGYAVTIHQQTQKFFKVMNFTTTAVYLDWSPSWSDREKSNHIISRDKFYNLSQENARYLQRRSVVAALSICNRPKHLQKLIIPKRYDKIIKSIYTQMGFDLATMCDEPFDDVTISKPSLNLEHYFDHQRGAAFIYLHEPSNHMFSALLDIVNHYIEGMAYIIHVGIALIDSDIDKYIEQLLQSGFKFAGVIPFWNLTTSHLIMMQYIGELEHPIQSDDLFCPIAKEICMHTA